MGCAEQNTTNKGSGYSQADGDMGGDRGCAVAIRERAVNIKKLN